ncbi:MAG TPA: phosphatidate cytidylyltransferase [Burkholderiales bacterium]|nr:phosphatidate cytidylyltransferase [Burkholderiales bacterium]
MLRQRILTAIVLLVLLLGCAFMLPSLAWQLLLCVPIALAADEWALLAGYSKRLRVAFIVVLLGSCAAIILALASEQPAGTVAAFSRLLFSVALVFWTILIPLWLHRGWRVKCALSLGAAGWMVLIPAWLAAVFLQKSPFLLLAVLLVVWTADTAAYFSGRRFGHRKLAPQISPGKTWEGAIGAFAAALVYGLVASLVLQPAASGYDRTATLIFVASLTLLSIVGDLFESWIKRSAGAKDSGTLLPGHGGVLDRIDSLTAALPLAALHFLPALGLT